MTNMKKLHAAFLLLLMPCLGLSASVRTTAYPASVRKMNLQPGDTVCIADGIYSDVRVRFLGHGTPEAPIVLRAKTPGGVTFAKGASVSVDGSYLVFEGFRFEGLGDKVSCYVATTDSTSRCRISNCLFKGAEGPEDISRSRNFVQLRGCFNEVSDCAFLDKNSLGVSLGVNLKENSVAGHVIRNNFFTRPSVLRKGKSILNGQECIRLGSSTRCFEDACCTVSGNWFYHCDGEVETISSKSCGNTYEGNLFEECVGTLTLRHGNGCTVRGNFFLGGGRKGTGGVRIIGERHILEDNWMVGLRGRSTYSAVSVVKGYENPEPHEYFQVRDAVIRSNKIIDCDYGIQIAIPTRPENVLFPEGLSVEKNLIVCNRASQKAISVYEMDDSDINWKDNVIWGGTQEGVSLKKARRAPKIELPEDQIQSIRDRAGQGSFWKADLVNYLHSTKQ